ncbi:IniB N-terminal domain-containing protein [Actinocrispum sp. NPDC049592]|uniref:IniB N-terminal domain-containing protein n=1 Tax=Actinocrispum sp. NPDC049592 TaxID=3154835 RepID=UPI0034357225
MIAQSLLDFILELLRDPSAQQEFRDDPGGTLDKHGFHGLCGQDVADVLPLVADNSRVSLDRSYDVGNNNVHPVVPPPPHPMPGDHSMHGVVRQFEYITNTYTWNDSHNTVVDNSVNQNIWAKGDVFQLFDNDPVVASGDGAVAAGDDVHNASTGGGVQSFGNGDAYNLGDITASGAGSAVAVGDGSATGSADDNSTDADIHNFGAGEVAVAGTGASVNQSQDSHNVSDSFNHTDSHDDTNSHNISDSLNHTDSHDDVNSHNHVDSHDDLNSNNHIDSHDDVNSHNDTDIASHNHDSHDDIASNNHLDVNSHNHNDLLSHNDVLILP